MIDLTKPLQLRNGAPVRILCTNADVEFCGQAQPIIGISRGRIYTWSTNGRYNPRSGDSDLDLINKKTKVKVEIRVILANDSTPIVFAVPEGQNFSQLFAENYAVSKIVEIEY